MSDVTHIRGRLRPAFRRIRASAAAVLLTGAVAAAIPAALPGAPGTARAAAAGCDGPAGDAFYDVPSSLPAGNGTLISCRQVTLNLGLGTAANTAWQFIYTTTDARGDRVASSATLAVPAAAWTGAGTRPVVALAPGTQGLAGRCAFSKGLVAGGDYEAGAVQAALGAGMAVAAVDYEGYLNGQVHPWLVGGSAGRAVLDATRAALRVPGGGLSPGTDVGITGYSEGGQAALWAAQLAASYAPDLHVAATAAGGIPADLRPVADSLNGGLGAGFDLYLLAGMHLTHPGLPWDGVLNADGKAAVATVEGQCTVDTLLGYAFRNMSSFTAGGMSLDELFQQAGPDGVTWAQVLDSFTLGEDLNTPGGPYQVHFPTMLYRGLIDEIVPPAVQDAVRDAYCRAGVPVKRKLYVGEHSLSLVEARGDVVSFLRDAFDGRPAENDC